MEKLLEIRKNVVTILAILAISIIATIPAPAEEAPSAELSVAALSQYIWRGQELSRDSMVVQPSLTIGYKGFSANIWGNLDTDPYTSTPGADEPSNWNETDFTLSYGKEFGALSAEAGYIYYGLDGTYDSQEAFLSLGLDTVLSPTLTVYKEMDSYPLWYFLFGISHSFDVTETVSLELAASASYLKSDDAEDYPEIDDNGTTTGDKFSNFHDGVISASLPIAIDQYVTVTPSLSYTFPLSSDASNEMEWRSQRSKDDNFVYGGVTVSMAF
jgi:uncharacterized protein (TIGR02001 family)